MMAIFFCIRVALLVVCELQIVGITVFSRSVWCFAGCSRTTTARTWPAFRPHCFAEEHCSIPTCAILIYVGKRIWSPCEFVLVAFTHEYSVAILLTHGLHCNQPLLCSLAPRV